MSNLGATILIGTGLALATVATLIGDADLGDLALLSFALLIAYNCQDWKGAK